jgi:hypothetical protein
LAIEEFFGEYFIYFERTDEDEVPGGGVVVYPAGIFE